MLQHIYIDENETKLTKSNAEILDETYFEYHGRYDDGDSPADSFEQTLVEGALIA